MEKQLKVSISGVRGILGNSGLSMDDVFAYSRAYASLFPAGSSIAVGRDSRGSGDMIFRAISAVLNSAGLNVINCGIVPTPTVSFTVKEKSLAGGIVISASHNPIEWNALKFIGKMGRFLTQKELDELLKRVEAPLEIDKPWNEIGSLSEFPDAAEEHAKACADFINSEKVRQSGLKVACDYVNGAGLISTPLLLNILGVKEESINDTVSGTFAHKPEPGIETMKELSELVKSSNADVGFIQDPDADRLALVDENGRILSEEYTLVLCAKSLWKKRKGPAAVNLSSSRMIDDVAAEFGEKVFRSKIGEINVRELMDENGLYFGGEGNGGLILPEISPGRDSILAIAVILELIAESGKPLSALADEIPAYSIVKDKLPVSEIDNIKLKDALSKIFPEGEISAIDGVKVSFEKSWLHVRPSNTEPIVRVFAEAREKHEAESLVEKAKESISSIS